MRRYISAAASSSHTAIRALLSSPPVGERVSVAGWVRSARFQKRVGFLEVNDGSCAANLQVVLPIDAEGSAGGALAPGTAAALTTGASVRASGTLVKSPKPGQPVELAADDVAVMSGAEAATYPLQKKAHSAEFLRSVVHLRARAAAPAAILRMRSVLAASLHANLSGAGCVHVHTPILTANDCEGGGELFSVGTSNATPFFGRPVFLTVSGQLHLEAFAAALSRVYTFGPTFRAENSNTTRHLAEFWMVEPEIAPARLLDGVRLCEDSLRAAAAALLSHAVDDIAVCARENPAGPLVRSRLERAAHGNFPVISYGEALARLASAPPGTFSARVPTWGGDLSSEHERWLAAEGPVFVTHYPATLKPFYMSLDEPRADFAAELAATVFRDPAAANAARATVACFDLLVPDLGELAGGSAREERLEVLATAMRLRGLLSPTTSAHTHATTKEVRPPADPADGSLDWYLDLRRYGAMPSAGWGMGFERLVAWCCGLDNVRDAIPVPRVVGAHGCRM